jgi:uncharacterized heparinase superfamily protein
MLGSAALAKVRKLKGRSVEELRERGMQATYALIERFAERASDPTERDFERWLAGRHGDGLPRGHQGAFPRADDLRNAAQFAKQTKQPWIATTIQAADRVASGLYDLLGYSGLTFGSDLDWHLDPVSGKRSPIVHWSRVPFLDADVVGDHKVIWELNRHQHLVLLGRAYLLTGDEKYARTCAFQLISWMDSNPPKVGINWASSLEVAYRLIAWIWCLEIFDSSPAFSDALKRRVLKFVHVHATHLEKYLSTYFSPNTHLTGEALGLWYAGNAFPFYRRATRWKDLGWSILEKQIGLQVYPDGVYFEQATYYHRYTIDIYTHAILIARAGGYPVPPAMMTAMERLVAFLAAVSRPDGSIPFIGDDDGGQLLRLEERSCADARAAFASASLLLENPWYKGIAGGLPEESLWLFGGEAAASFDLDRPAKEPAPSQLFAEGGYAVIRDGWGRDSSSVVVDCGPVGSGNAGHGHADALSVLITIGGRPLFVDPGTGTYTADPAVRNWFRDSRAHNSVAVDDTSSSVPAGPFTWSTMARTSMDAFHDSATASVAVASHNGYQRLSDPVNHQRLVLFIKRRLWLIWDVIDGTGEHSATATFQCAPDASAVVRDSHSVHLLVDGKSLASLTALGDAGSIEVASSLVSECYGLTRLAPVCRSNSRKNGRHDLLFVIAIAEDGAPPTVSSKRIGDTIQIDVVRADGTETIAATTSTAAVDRSITDASLMWISRGSNGDPRAAGFRGGSFLRLPKLHVSAVEPGWASVEQTDDRWRGSGHVTELHDLGS